MFVYRIVSESIVGNGTKRETDGLDNIQTCLYYFLMGNTKAPSSEARQRLLETADRLFYREGIRSVGIDKIIAEAGVAKMTLYSHFSSKDELILAVLKHREQFVVDFFQAAIERHVKEGQDQLEAFFAALKDWMQQPEFRGCAFINATIELADFKHPGSEYARSQKERFDEMLRGLIAESLGKNATGLLPAISLLVEGAIVTAQIQGHPGAADTARETANKLIAARKGS